MNREEMRALRESYHDNAESITYTSGKHGTAGGIKWTAAPGYGASVYTNDAGAVVATVGEIWKPTSFDAVALVNQYRKKFPTREDARVWCSMMATAHGYPEQTARPEYDLFTV